MCPVVGSTLSINMGEIFQITGIPRFGSAFVSVLMSMEPKCIGIHDQGAEDPNWIQSIQDLAIRWDYVADCSTYGFFPKATISGAKKVYVKKSPVESAKSASGKFGYTVDENAVHSLREIGDAWAVQHSALIIEENQLFRLESLRAIWNYCFQGNSVFPEEKALRLLTMNVQRHNPWEVFSIENSNRLAKQLF